MGLQGWGRLDIVGWKGKVKLSEREREKKGEKKKTMLKLQLLWPLFAAFLDRLGGYGGKGMALRAFPSLFGRGMRKKVEKLYL